MDAVLMMNAKTTTTLALAGTLLAAPAALADEEAGQPPTPLRASLAGHPTVESQMRAAARENRVQDRRRRAVRRARRRAAQAPPVSPALEAIAACESGGNPRAIGGGGLYRGKYQFDLATWRSVGGRGDPANAPEAEQDRRAAILYDRAGASPWPVCGR